MAASDADRTEISLTENVARLPMHPADEIEAFRALIETGQCAADVAARFGVSETVVQQRLALARVSPSLLQQYRNGEMDLETLKAFTLTDDHTAQEEVWQQIPSWNRDPASTVRQLLSRHDIPANDRRVRFVGLQEYEAEAGLLRRDLFAEGEQGTYILDAAKLNRLAAEKLERLAEREKADGWKWIEIQPDLDRQSVSRLRRLQPERVPLPEKVQKKIQSLEAKRDKFQLEAQQSDDDASDALWVQVDVLDEKIRDFKATAEEAYSAATKAQSGVVVSVGSQGEPAYTRGLLRKENEKTLHKSSRAAETNHPSAGTLAPEAEPETKGYSAALVESLTQHKTAAIAVEFTRQPLVALAATVHAFVLSHFHLDLHLYRSQTSIQISTTPPHLGDAADSAAGQALLAQQREWLAVLPRSSKDRWQWCLAQQQDTLLRLLAFCTASSINAVRVKADGERDYRLQHADWLATALRVDCANWFTPTAENCFDRISKAQIAQALSEAGAPPDATVLAHKKAQLAKIAEAKISGTGWLPAPLRIQDWPGEEIGNRNTCSPEPREKESEEEEAP